MKVWTYWEGPMPSHIAVCLGSMKMVLGQDLTVLGLDTAKEAVGDRLNPNWLKLSRPALRADALRAALLATYGGWWWDADTIALRKPDCLSVENASVLYTTWTKMPVRVLNGYIWFAENSSIAVKWLNSVNAALEYPENIDWTAIGEKLLTGLILGKSTAVKVSRRMLLPIDIDSDVKHFFEHRDLRTYLSHDPVCFGLNHSWFMYHRPKQMAIESWNDDLLIHQLLKHALK